MTKEKYIIPYYLQGVDYYCKAPEWYRKDGGKFVINDDLTDKECEYLISVGFEIIRLQEPEIKAKVKPKKILKPTPCGK